MRGGVQLQYAAKRGFYLVAQRPGAKLKEGTAPPLPRKFIQLDGGTRNRSTVACTTAELNALNARLKDATNDCMIITQQVGCPPFSRLFRSNHQFYTFKTQGMPLTESLEQNETLRMCFTWS